MDDDFKVYGYVLWVFFFSMLAETADNRRVILMSCEFEGLSRCLNRYVPERLLLVGKWTSVPLSRHVVFPTNSRREVILSSSSGHCWLRQNLSIALLNLSFRHVRLLLPARGFWELLHFWIFSFRLISTIPKEFLTH